MSRQLETTLSEAATKNLSVAATLEWLADLELEARNHRAIFLFRIYRAGKNSIERGNRDTWTLTPKLIAAVEAAHAKEQAAQGGGRGEVAAGGEAEGSFGRGANLPSKYWEQLHQPANRDPRGYVVPSDQPDFATATRFIQALQKAGIVVRRATAAFPVAGKQYPAGSYVVKAAQSFRPHLRDMFEPQDHPNDFEYPGGPPKRPYDITGYTLAYRMAVRFDRILASTGRLRRSTVWRKYRRARLRRPAIRPVTCSATA